MARSALQALIPEAPAALCTILDGARGAAYAARLGLLPHENFADIVRQYIDDCAALPNADQTLKGMKQ